MYARAQAAAKARPLPRDKLTSSRSKVPRPMPPSRALATFGNPFGLALYDREQLGVRKARSEKVSLPIGPWVLCSASGAEEGSFDKPSEFAAALRKSMSEANDIELFLAVSVQTWDPSSSPKHNFRYSNSLKSARRSSTACCCVVAPSEADLRSERDSASKLSPAPWRSSSTHPVDCDISRRPRIPP